MPEHAVSARARPGGTVPSVAGARGALRRPASGPFAGRRWNVRRVVGAATLAVIVTLFNLSLGQGVAAGLTGTCSVPGGSVIIARDLKAGDHSAAAASVVVDASYSMTEDGRIQLDGWTSSELIDAVYVRSGPHVWELPGGQSGGAFVPPDGFSITQIRWCASTDSVPPTTISPPKDPGPVLPPAPTTTLPGPTTTTTVPDPTTTTTTVPEPVSPTTSMPGTTTTTEPEDEPAPAPEPGGVTTTTRATTTTTTPVSGSPGGAGSEDQRGEPAVPADPDRSEGPDLATAEATTTTSSTTTVAIVEASPRPQSDPQPPAIDDVALGLPLSVPAPVEDSIELFSRMTTSQQVLVGTGLGLGSLLSGIGIVRRMRMPKLP